MRGKTVKIDKHENAPALRRGILRKEDYEKQSIWQ